MKTILLGSFIVLAGCTINADVERIGKLTHCTDTRDGEKFTFSDKSITNVRYGIGADSCFTVKDESGVVRNLCKSHEVFLKCENTFFAEFIF